MANNTVWVIYYYVDTPREWADYDVRELEPDNPSSWGAVGSNWQVGSDYPTREEADADGRQFLEEMKQRGYSVGQSYTASTF